MKLSRRNTTWLACGTLLAFAAWFAAPAASPADTEPLHSEAERSLATPRAQAPLVHARPTRPSAQREEIAATGRCTLIGHCRQRSDGAPLAGVRLKFAGLTGESVADANGRLAFEVPPGRELAPELAAPAGWRVEKAPAQLSASAAETVFEVWLVPSALTLRLLDDRTGEPLPDFALCFATLSGTRASGRTNDDGTWSPDLRNARGELELRLVDHDAAARHWPEGIAVAPQEAEKPFELRVPSGPTYRLDWSRLDRSRLEGGSTSGEWLAYLAPRSSSQWPVASVRGEDRGWVRFGPADTWLLPQEKGPWELLVWQRGTARAARATVHQVVGQAPQPAQLTAIAAGGISGRVTDPSGAPLARTRILVRSTATGTTRSVLSGADGAFELGAIEVGPVTVEARHELRPRVTRSVAITAGHIEELAFVLEPAPGAGSIVGRVVSLGEAPAAPPTGSAVLRGMNGTGGLIVQRLSTINHDGCAVSAFRFDAVPQGDYIVQLALDETHTLVADTIPTAPGAAPIEFYAERPAQVRPFVFDVFDAETGRALEAFEVLHTADGRAVLSRSLDGALSLRDVPIEAAFSWAVRASGYYELVHDACRVHVFDDRVEVEAPMRCGWSYRLNARDGAGRPLGGVEVLADGTSLGFTDGEGKLTCRHPEKPLRLSLSAEGWQHAGGDVSPVDGSYREDVPLLYCMFTPD
ncbi:MAG: carboxypeptidase regulatory-like domain-containing protein [bacterium]|nr:carboxypeptidase regulatory-like domain-containing protein [bacterium]